MNDQTEFYKKLLSDEGFKHVFVWHDDPGEVYELHAHKDKVALYVIEGEITLTFEDGDAQTVSKNERINVPVGKIHTAKAGSSGCDFVVGEMIEGDS